MLLRKNTYFILQTAIGRPVREIVVGGPWQIPMCVEITHHNDRVALVCVLVKLFLKSITEVVDGGETRPCLLEPPLVLVPQSIRAVGVYLRSCGLVIVDDDHTACTGLEL